MADNYLEKKMEEHRRQGGRSSYRPRLTPGGRRPGELVVEFSPCELFIEGIDAPGMTDAARELAVAGFKVCFSGGDIHRGSRLAATLGARFLPASMSPSGDAIRLRQADGHIELLRGRTMLRISLDRQPDADQAAAGRVVTQNIVWGAVMLANLNDFQENVLKNIKIEGFSL